MTAPYFSGKVLVAGGTRGVGKWVVERLLSLDVACRVMTRSRAGAAGLGEADIFEGTALDIGDCAHAVEGCNAIICTIGERSIPKDRPIVDGQGVFNLADAAIAAGIGRFILVSTLGAGDSWPLMPFPLRWYIRLRGIYPLFQEKTRAEAYLIDGGLDWTILRPGGLINSKMRSEPLLTTGGRAGGSTRRQTVADLAVRCLQSPNSIGQTITVLERWFRFTAKGSPRTTLDVPWEPWG